MATSMVFCIGDLGQSSLLLRNHAHFHLHQGAGSRKCFLEKLQSIIVVQDLDSFRQCNLLFSTHLHVCLVLLLLRGAVCVQVREELLVLSQGLLGITQVVLHLHDRYARVSDAHCLVFNAGREGLDLLRFGSHEPLVGLDGGGFRSFRLRQALGHGVLHLLENADDLATRRCILVILLRGEEGRDLIPVVLGQAAHLGNHLAQELSSVRLQEARHAFLERINC
mmetsp:Transcript_27902/g.48567  ORF Transcript_27902/g.48567 Transcript_27902/m.48567 type:complete len:223 (+) Transcript_27902:412-1080(+)